MSGSGGVERAAGDASVPGRAHLVQLGGAPRPAGGEAEKEARAYAAGILRDAGFIVRAERITYSEFPGRYATPVGGALGAITVLGAARIGLASPTSWHAAAALAAGLALLGLFARAMLGDAVLDLPLRRAESLNLVATRGDSSPNVWLVAHLDSKSQPVPSAARVAGIALLAAAVVVAGATALASLMQPAAPLLRTGWWAAAVLAVAGGPVVVASVVGTASDGAVDNASGVATVLLAATRVGATVPVGVLLPSAEELGLAGARAFVRAWARGGPDCTALNCDGIDDEGTMTIMYSGVRPAALLDVMRQASSTPSGVRRLPMGLLTDSVAFTDVGWTSVTLSRGGWGTLRRIHTRGDSLRAIRGTGLDAAATLLARAVEALA